MDDSLKILDLDGFANLEIAGDIDKVLADNKIKLEQISVKKGRGRPKGSIANPGPVINPLVNITKLPLQPMLKDAVKYIPFGIIADSTGYPGFNIEDKEAENLASMAEECIRLYFPTSDNKNMPLYILCGTIMASLLVKYRGYKTFTKDAVRINDNT
jgi:hypothetical protein